jgi:hypothetical protein
MELIELATHCKWKQLLAKYALGSRFSYTLKTLYLEGEEVFGLLMGFSIFHLMQNSFFDILLEFQLS